MAERVKYEGLSKAEVLVALYNSAKAMSLNVTLAELLNIRERIEDVATSNNELTIKEAKILLESTESFDYINGRPIKVDLSDDEEFDPTLYDRDNGRFAGLNAVLNFKAKKLAKRKAVKSVVIDKNVKFEPINIEIESSSKVIESEDININKIENEMSEKQVKQGVIPELKWLKWDDYAKKHTTTITKAGTELKKGQVLYIETLKYNWASKHIHFVSELNKKIEEYNKVIAENGIEDAELPKIMASIRVLVSKYKEMLSDCENFDEVSSAIKQQSKDLRNIKISTLNQ